MFCCMLLLILGEGKRLIERVKGGINTSCLESCALVCDLEFLILTTADSTMFYFRLLRPLGFVHLCGTLSC